MRQEAAGMNRPATTETVADPITTEVIRNGLVTAAEHMKVVLCRAAYSPVIYEMYDFACALFDRDVRVLGQGRGMPLFLGTLGPSVTAIVEAVGGEEHLRPGDVSVLDLRVRDRLPPARRGGRLTGLPRRRARRIRRGQGSSPRCRRQGAVLHGHRRHLPGGRDLPGREALAGRRSPGRPLPDARRELAPSSGARRRPQCRGRCGEARARRAQRTHRPPGEVRLRLLRRGDVRPRRGADSLLSGGRARRTIRRRLRAGRQRPRSRARAIRARR